jgi:ATP-dependent RNA helicase DeaD
MFSDLFLSEPVLAALGDVGYEMPTPIQAATIPHLLAGTDVVGEAQTGTGKTAAFALPLLSKIDLSLRATQVLVLVPTRELAMQVAEAFERYASHLPSFNVVAIYGGQSYTPQLKSLRRGAHVVVATPGRVMDHLKRGTLQLDSVRHLVLDEADEMLRMGFIDDVEWVLQQAPPERQVALFSATMPPAIRRIAQQHLRSPVQVTISHKATASKIRQRYWIVSGMHKLDALTRILEAETYDGMLVFTRTKQSTVELAEQLERRGFAVEALNGDIPQPQRERTIARVKARQVDIVVATDVAARGLDIERLSHVVNFDLPHDPESYVHRIGRTGRAGRNGEAILFIAPRERNVLRVIERVTRQSIEPMQLPSVADVNRQRVARFNQRITAALAAGEAEQFQCLIEQYQREHDVPALAIAAALASLLQGKTPLLLSPQLGDVEPPAVVQPVRQSREFDRRSEAEPVRRSHEFKPRPAADPARQPHEFKRRPAAEPVRQSHESEPRRAAEPVRQSHESAPRPAVEPVRQSHESAPRPAVESVRQPHESAPRPAVEPVRQSHEFEPRPAAPARSAKKERPARLRRRAARALARAAEGRKSPPANLVSRNAFALAGRNDH